jgi:hypothetical protein
MLQQAEASRAEQWLARGDQLVDARQYAAGREAYARAEQLGSSEGASRRQLATQIEQDPQQVITTIQQLQFTNLAGLYDRADGPFTNAKQALQTSLQLRAEGYPEFAPIAEAEARKLDSTWVEKALAK